jgi:iduronate 2-sulfatase
MTGADIPPLRFAHNNTTPHYDLDELTCRKALQAYRASVSFVDAQVGRLLDALDRLKISAATPSSFFGVITATTSGSTGASGKRERFLKKVPGPRSSFAHPDAAGNGRDHAAASSSSWTSYPTLADLASLTPPSTLDGRSLRPLLNDPAHEWDGIAITQIVRPADDRLPAMVMGRSIRTERWRFTEWNGGADGLELYDHNKDPHEFYNRARMPSAEASKVMKAFHARFSNLARGLLPSSSVNPKRL